MIWLTWRQHRKQFLGAVAGLFVLALVVVPTGLHMHHVFHSSGLAACVAKVGKGNVVANSAVGDCQALSGRFRDQFDVLSLVGILFVMLPLFVGLFFGAPLVAREVEHGTHRFVWTQGVGRLHWALVKFGVVGAVTVLFAVVYGFGVSWWYAPYAATGTSRMGYLWFDVQGVAPIGYTLFAVALGVCAGTFFRKVVPAMAVTLGGFVVVRVLVEVLARGHYLSAKTLTFGVTSGESDNPFSGAWVVAREVRDAAGKVVAENATVGCPPEASGGTCGQGPAGHPLTAGAYNWMSYQPGNRFWTFQGIETGLFLALTAALVVVAVLRTRRIA